MSYLSRISPFVRRTFVLVMLVIGILFIIQQSDRLMVRFGSMSDDFVAYWAAGRANLRGQNPYDLDLLLVIQQSAGWPDETTPYLFRYPPIALVPFMLLGSLPFSIARLIWLLVSLILLLVSSLLFWRLYRSDTQKGWLALAVTGAFAPAMLAIAEGQTTPLMVFGLACFLFFERRKNWFLAGISTILLTSKPQILYLFWISILIWTIHRRRWSLVGGGVLALVITAWLASLTNAAVLSQYLQDVWRFLPTHWSSMSALGTGLRLLFGYDKQWLQFAPAIIGLGWLVFYWIRHKAEWNWSNTLPVLALVSVVTAPSAWIHDQTVFLIAVLVAFTRIIQSTRVCSRYIYVLIFLLINGIGFASFNTLRYDQVWYFWMPGAFLAWFLLIEYRERLLVNTAAGSEQQSH